MKKRLKSFGIPALVLSALAVVLLGGGVVGSTRAALNYYSSVYKSEIDLPKIGVELYENGVMVGKRNYDWNAESMSAAEASAYSEYNDETDAGWDTETEVTGLLRNLTYVNENGETVKDAEFKLERKYQEELKVKNGGTIPVFVRVNVYRYWTEKDANGKEVKVQALDPDYINLRWNVGEGSGWVMDKTVTTKERTVLYYTHVLDVETETVPFTDAFWIPEDVKDKSVTVTDGTGFTTTYTYGGKQFHLEVVAEVVQSENGQDAIVSSWGVRNVEIDGNSLKVHDTDVIIHTENSETDEPDEDVSENDVSENDVSENDVSGEDTVADAVRGKEAGEIYPDGYAAINMEKIPDTFVKSKLAI